MAVEMAPPERSVLVVTVYFDAKAFGDPRSAETIRWPEAWPLPEQGDRIVLNGKSGFVTYRSFDFMTNTLGINTR